MQEKIVQFRTSVSLPMLAWHSLFKRRGIRTLYKVSIPIVILSSTENRTAQLAFRSGRQKWDPSRI
jgi:hypothetical protein